MTKPVIKVLIVEESLVMGLAIKKLLLNDSQIEVVGIAKGGEEAIVKARELQPHVITLDIEMPLLDDRSSLEYLIGQGPYAIVILSRINDEQANDTVKWLEMGAFDFIQKPKSIFEIASSEKQIEIIKKVKMAYNSLRNGNSLIQEEIKPLQIHPTIEVSRRRMEYIIVVAISTGGPNSLAKTIPLFPAEIPAAIVIVQHMPANFTASLAKRLNGNSRITVKEAEDMDELQAGYVYIAPGDYHLNFKKDDNKVIIKLNQEPPISGLRPSADVMMKSLAKVDFNPSIKVIGVVMTGMGSDGTKGLRTLKDTKGAYIIAQDEKSSVVFGMPRSAISQGLVDEIVSLQDIPTCIMNYMGVQG